MPKEPDFILLNTFLLCAAYGCENTCTFGKEFDNEPGKIYPLCIDHREKFQTHQLKFKPKYVFEKAMVELVQEPKDAV